MSEKIELSARWKNSLLKQGQVEVAIKILEEVRAGEDLKKAVHHNPLPEGGYIAKNKLVAVYRDLTISGKWQEDPELLAKIRLKPVRTLSGVTTVTVLTKPYPCPGECIFCPTDARMPQSYLPDEPGAMRALHHKFDPYAQVSARLRALEAVGHPVDKIELLILGGTWSSYRRDYQEWFVKQCLDAMNQSKSKSVNFFHVHSSHLIPPYHKKLAFLPYSLFSAHSVPQLCRENSNTHNEALFGILSMADILAPARRAA